MIKILIFNLFNKMVKNLGVLWTLFVKNLKSKNNIGFFDLNIENKVVVVTGGARGISRTAKRFLLENQKQSIC